MFRLTCFLLLLSQALFLPFGKVFNGDGKQLLPLQQSRLLCSGIDTHMLHETVQLPIIIITTGWLGSLFQVHNRSQR